MQRNVTEEIERRRKAMLAMLSEVAPYSFTDQRHLDASTPERAYWHQGYCAALGDVLRLLGRDGASPVPDSRDTSEP